MRVSERVCARYRKVLAILARQRLLRRSTQSEQRAAQSFYINRKWWPRAVDILNAVGDGTHSESENRKQDHDSTFPPA
jgi:hypothetical protein